MKSASDVSWNEVRSVPPRTPSVRARHFPGLLLVAIFRGSLCSHLRMTGVSLVMLRCVDFFGPRLKHGGAWQDGSSFLRSRAVLRCRFAAPQDDAHAYSS